MLYTRTLHILLGLSGSFLHIFEKYKFMYLYFVATALLWTLVWQSPRISTIKSGSLLPKWRWIYYANK